MTPSSPCWDDAFLAAWGGALGRIHRASQGWSGAHRRAWDEERIVRRAAEILPADQALRAEMEACRERLRSLPRDAGNFGLTHGDFGTQNFRYLPGPGGPYVTAFDFDNACHHFYACDLAVALTTLPAHPERDAWRSRLIAGYREQRPLPHDFAEMLPWFTRGRWVYVYVVLAWTDKAHLLTAAQRERLQDILAQVREAGGRA